MVPSGFIVVNSLVERPWRLSYKNRTVKSRLLQLSWEVPAHITVAISLTIVIGDLPITDDRVAAWAPAATRDPVM